MFVFMPVPHCFDYCSFVVSFEIRNGESFRFVFLFQDCFWLFRIPWDSIWILEWSFLSLQKMSWDFDRDCIDSVDHFGWYWHLLRNNILWIGYTPILFIHLSVNGHLCVSHFLALMNYVTKVSIRFSSGRVFILIYN